MQNLVSLLFELSNEDRLKIMELLSNKTMNVTSLSRRLNLSLQETSRHVQRLHKIGLIRKDTNLYHIAPYAEFVLRHLKALRFLSRHSNYFNNHSLTRLPKEFARQVDDLSECRYEDDSVLIWSNVQRIVEEAKDHIWSLTERYDVATAYTFPRAISRGVKMMNIDLLDQIIRRDDDIYRMHIFAENWQPVIDARKTGQLKERVLEKIDTFLWISDTEAVLAFPANNGKFDYQGFVCKDENSLGWCRNLFQHYWEKARTLESAIDELYRWITKRPEALDALRKIVTNTKVTQREELILELQQRGLVADGRITEIGRHICEMLQR